MVCDKAGVGPSTLAQPLVNKTFLWNWTFVLCAAWTFHLSTLNSWTNLCPPWHFYCLPHICWHFLHGLLILPFHLQCLPLLGQTVVRWRGNRQRPLWNCHRGDDGRFDFHHFLSLGNVRNFIKLSPGQLWTYYHFLYKMMVRLTVIIFFQSRQGQGRGKEQGLCWAIWGRKAEVKKKSINI